jgi:hypothetical protein
MKVSLYIDEDSMSHSLVDALRARGVDVLTPADVGMMGHSDEEQLQFAADSGRAFFSFNVGDFFHLHTEWQSIGREHAGIILAQQQQFSIGELMRRILRLMAGKSAEAMRNQSEFLSTWS